jgi:Zn-dependent peptidase ImmA (M78 family)
MSARVAVAPSLLLWAQERSQREDDALEKKFPAWQEWLKEAKEPTIKQVEELARYTHLPFGVFFLGEPPQVELPIPDYRLGRSGDEATPSQELLDVIDVSVKRQAWFVDYARKIGLDDAAIARVGEQDSPLIAADAAAEELSFTVADRARLKTRENARNHLRRRFEELGGLVVITSMVGNDNHRMLDRDEFRGFTLADSLVPLIFVNSSGDSISGQLFTFLHEYGHVKLGKTGLSDEAPGRRGKGIEDWCNAFASEVLVPTRDLLTQFRRDVALATELDRLAGRYMCSTLVILLKLRSLDLVGPAGFDSLYRAEEQRATDAFEFQRQKNVGGGDFYANQPFRVGERLSRAVLSDVREGGTSFTDAFRVLGLRNAEQLRKYSEQLGV